MTPRQGRFLVFFAILYCVTTLDLPPEFKKCKRTDSSFDQCLKIAISDALPLLKNGLPDFKLPSVQPIEIPSLTIGAGTGPVNVVQNYKNVKIYGIPLGKVQDVKTKFNDTWSFFEIRSTFNEIKIVADYNSNGQILLLPVAGNGDCVVIFKNTKGYFNMTGETVVKKGKRYIEIQELNVHLDPYKMDFTFNNLFNGDERLGNEMNKLFNENWKEIWLDVGHGYEEALAAAIKNVVNILFKQVPSDILFPMK